ncbi:hypothetical protein O0880_04505 [Janthinobacterium sp. SUN118]|uniref:hypothetical protein n=1 Tax=Janthinobacterium sp. SUN118 TaxID=3004100 RepID=UPI0025AF4198|nr:hypothetical protein [Janthinobacterium sp. SUN118]MDN2708678.1 hypothetical protein [Janthinobacterium sp. SUN118]
MRKFFAALCFLSFSISNACALETATGKVMNMEATYLPGTIFFQLDGGSASCPAGARIEWSKADQANNKAIYATLLTSLVSGVKVGVVINDGDKTCKGQFIYVIAN